MEEVVTIKWNDSEEEIVLHSITYGDFKNIRRKSLRRENVDGKITTYRDLDLYDMLFIIK